MTIDSLTRKRHADEELDRSPKRQKTQHTEQVAHEAFFNPLLPDFSYLESETENKEKVDLKSRLIVDYKEKHITNRQDENFNETESQFPSIKITSLNINDNFAEATIGEKLYRLRKLGKGNFHTVYEFLDRDKILQIGNRSLPVEKLVVRVANSRKQEPVGRDNKKKLLKKFEGDFTGIQRLSQLFYDNRPLGIETYAAPKFPRALEEITPLNWVWIRQKVAQNISTEGWSHGETMDQLKERDKKVLEFARNVLTEFADLRYAVEDFFPQNVLSDGDNFYIIDAMFTESDEWVFTLQETLKAWSGVSPKDKLKGNREVWDYLAAHLPDKIYQEVVRGRP